ncbi:MAG: hypothetical protein MUF30_08815 [Burkholderiales bacterium]|nr:hypothetical protein [Burkholderiales bacterium]
MPSPSPSRASSALARPGAAPVVARHGGCLSVAERDALYRDNAAARDADRPIAPDARVDTLSVAALGLGQATISRLVRAGWLTVGDVLRQSPEALWRSVGRHGVADLLARFERHALPLPTLTDYERWRLGRVERREIAVHMALDTPLPELWPLLGMALGSALVERGFHSVGDLVPRDEDRLLALYRLGKANLRKVRAVLDALRAEVGDADRAAVDAGIARLDAHSEPGRRHRDGPAGGRIATDPGAPTGQKLI